MAPEQATPHASDALEPVNRPVNEPINAAVVPCVNEPVNEPANEPVNNPGAPRQIPRQKGAFRHHFPLRIHLACVMCVREIDAALYVFF